MTETSTALEVVEAVRTLAKFLGEDAVTTMQHLVFMDEAKCARLQGALKLYNAYLDMDIPDRARALGMTVTEEVSVI